MYEPKEDSWLLKKQLKDLDLEGKIVLEIGAGKAPAGLQAAEQGADVSLSDNDPETIKYLEQNVERPGISIRKSDLFDNIENKFEVILFNPPYLPGKRQKSSDPLNGGEGGTEVIEKFLDQCDNYITKSGRCIFILSSKMDLDELKSKHDFEILDTEKLWFESLFVAETS